MSHWQPTASIALLQTRARALQQLREFFASRNVLEVETPLLGRHTVTEPMIDSYALQDQEPERYLQTSPEYAMKRLLAAGAPDIFQICKCFRRGEQGRTHNPEFTMIEWYRRGFTLQQIMQETTTLIASLCGAQADVADVDYLSYAEVYQRGLGKSFFDLSAQDISQIATDLGLQSVASLSRAQQTDFIFSQLVANHLDPQRISCVFHYPAEQAALAQLNAADTGVADRFEVFSGGLELANGYVELRDVDQQQQRFSHDQAVRQVQQLEAVAADTQLLAALSHGLPACAGVAVGFDRLLMLASKTDRIEQVMSFAWENA